MNHEEDLDRKMKNLISNVKNTDVELKDAVSLTDDIMGAVTGDLAKDSGLQDTIHGNIFRNVVFRRIISAAAIFLFSIFAYEQFIILDRVNRLEIQCKADTKNQHWEFQAMKTFQGFKDQNKALSNILQNFHQKAFLFDQMKGNKVEAGKLYKSILRNKALTSFYLKNNLNRRSHEIK